MPGNPLQPLHEQAEASFLPYSPIVQLVESYGEVEAEYAAVRKAVGLMDLPHRAVVVLTGRDRLSFLHNLVTNDTKALVTGQGCYAYMLNTRGRILLDMNILHAEDATLLDVDARAAASLCQQLEKFHFSEDVRILDASDQLGRLAIIGPNAQKLLARVAEPPPEPPQPTPMLWHARRTIARMPVTLFRNDQCGEVQYDLIVPRDQLVAVWQLLQEAGNGHGETHDSGMNLRTIGWAAFNVARIEAGTPLFGIDITDQNLPMETAHWYARAVSVTKGCYVGQEIVARMHSHNTVARLLAGLKIAGDHTPPAGAALQSGQTQVGALTSSCTSPMLGYVPVALGYLRRADAQVGNAYDVLFAEGPAKATVAALPFWRKTPPV